MDPVDLTEATITQHSFPQSFRRGQEYFERGAVVTLTQQGDDLLADVEGSGDALDRLTVALRPAASATSPRGRADDIARPEPRRSPLTGLRDVPRRPNA